MAEPGSTALCKLEGSLHRFVRVAIPTDTERLLQHCRNIEKFWRSSDWERLHTEQRNARSTVQQIQASAQELCKLRALLQPSDLPAFEKCTNPPRRRALDTVLAILALDTPQGPQTPPRSPVWAGEMHTHLIKRTSPFASREPPNLPGEREESVEEYKWIPLPIIPRQCKAKDSWKKLQQDLLALPPLLFDEFHKTQHVPEQEINYDRREAAAAATVAQDNPRFKITHLRKVALWPVAGAVIGGVVAGPLGMLTGLKVAVVAAALSGGLVGFTGGKLVQKWKQRKGA